MESHSVTCHPTQVNAPSLNPSKLVLDLPIPEGRKAELTIGYPAMHRPGVEFARRPGDALTTTPPSHPGVYP